MSNYHKLYTPADSAVVFIDHQPQMLFGVAGIDRAALINNVTLLAKVAKEFKVPAVLTAVETESFSGYVWPQLLDVFPDQPVVERTSMNSWDDAGFRAAIEATGKKNIIMTGLWTEVCVTWPTIEMLGAGYNVYVVEDCCGATSPAAQEAALSRMVQAGAVRLTSTRPCSNGSAIGRIKSITTRSWDCSNSRQALTAAASNTPTRWFITRRNRHRNPRSFLRRRIE
jgi:nicotinamidase-related amidase